MFHTLETLTTIPKSTTRAKSPLNIVMEMTLQLYPKHVRAQLPDYNTMDLKEFLRQADRILAAYNESVILAASVTPKPEDSSDSESEVTAPVRMKSVVVKPDRQPPRRKAPSQKELCYYHRRFGPKAFRCQAPCDWTPKNAWRGCSEAPQPRTPLHPPLQLQPTRRV